MGTTNRRDLSTDSIDMPCAGFKEPLLSDPPNILCLMGRSTKYTKEVLLDAVKNSVSIAGVLRHLGLRITGGGHAHISRRIKLFEIDTSHFTGSVHNRGKYSPQRHTAAQILIVRPRGSNRANPHRLRRALLEIGVSHQCKECALAGLWRDKPLVLHIDHVNGDIDDCRAENLRFLCPNCHSQTPTYAGRAPHRRP